MFKSLSTALLAAYASANECQLGFYNTLQGCKCWDQWAVPVEGADICECLDKTSTWMPNGSFCKMPNPETMAYINSVRTRYYPFNTNADARVANSKKNLNAWAEKEIQRSAELRDAGFDVEPAMSWSKGKPWAYPAGWAWYPYGAVPSWWPAGVDPKDWPVPAGWAGAPFAWVNWDPTSPDRWYWAGAYWAPKGAALPLKWYNGERWWYWSGRWWNYPASVKAKAHDRHNKRVAEVEATVAAGKKFIDASAVQERVAEDTPWSNNLGTIVKHLPAGNGYLEYHPQWQGTANPFNKVNPDFHKDAASWPNNDRLPSTHASKFDPNVLQVFTAP